MILDPQYQDDLQALPVDQREWAGLVSTDNTKQIKVKSKKKRFYFEQSNSLESSPAPRDLGGRSHVIELKQGA